MLVKVIQNIIFIGIVHVFISHLGYLITPENLNISSWVHLKHSSYCWFWMKETNSCNFRSSIKKENKYWARYSFLFQGNFMQKKLSFKSQTLLKQNAKYFFFSTHLLLFPVFPWFFEFHQITHFNLEWKNHNCKMVEISYLIIKMFSVVPIERTRGHGLEHKTFCLNIRNTYCVISGVLE